MKQLILVVLVSILLVGTGCNAQQSGVSTPTQTVSGEENNTVNPTTALQDDVWTSYVNANYVNCLAVEGDKLWVGTEVGALLIDPQKGTYIKYTASNSGLPSNSIRAIVVDEEGNKWFGTGTGVSVFDGTTWENYANAGSLVLESVRRMAIDDDGRIWVAYGNLYEGDGNLSAFDGNSWKTYGSEDGLPEGTVSCIFVANDGDIWFGGLGGSASVFDGSSWTSCPSGLGSLTPECIAEDNDDNVWFGTTSGLFRFDGSTFKQYSMSDGVGGYWFSDIAVDAKGNVWVGCIYGGGVSVFDGNTWTAYSTEDGLGWDWVKSIDVDADGNIWVGHMFGWGQSSLIGKKYTGGLSKFDGNTWTSFTIPGGPESNHVVCVDIDTEGNKWFGTQNDLAGSVCVYNGNTWTTFVSPYLTSVVCIEEDAEGNQWFGTFYYGVVVFSNGSIRTIYDVTDGLASDRVRDMEIDTKGNIWVGDIDGVSVFDGNTWVKYPYKTAYDIAIDTNGNIWFTSWSDVMEFDGESWTKYTKADGLAADYVYSVTIDDDGNKWFGTNNGVIKYDGNKWTTYDTENGLVSNYIGNIAVDGDGNIWFCSGGPESNGVSRYDGNTWRTYTIKDGLASNSVSDIAVDEEGNIWFATDRGVSKFGKGLPSGPPSEMPLIVTTGP